MKYGARAFLLLLIGLLAAGCSTSTAKTAEELPAPVVLPAAGAEITATPEGPPANSMLVIVSKRGLLSVLTNDGWLQPHVPAAFTSGAYCLPANSSVGFDAGAAWAQCGPGTIASTGGQAWTTSPANTSHLVTGPDGRAATVTATQVTVGRADGSALTYTPEGALGLRAFPASAATYASDGTLWLAGQIDATGVQLISFDGRQWQRHGGLAAGLGLKPTDNLRRLAAARDGGLWATTDNQLLHFNGSRFDLVVDQSKFALQYKSGVFNGAINDLLVLANGDVWLATSEGIYTFNGRDLALLDRGDGLPAKDVRGLAVDTSGRIWAATAYGLALFSGGRWQVITPATSGLTDADLVALAVRGAPPVPAATTPAKTTTITGRIIHAGGLPLADTSVILCDEGPGANHRHGEPQPCAEQYYTREVKTDASGVYRFEDVPIGAYTIVANGRGIWYFAIRLPERDWQPIVALTPGVPVHLDMALP